MSEEQNPAETAELCASEGVDCPGGEDVVRLRGRPGAEPVRWIALFLAVLQTAAGEEDSACVEAQVRVRGSAGEQPAGDCEWDSQDWEEYTGKTR